MPSPPSSLTPKALRLDSDHLGDGGFRQVALRRQSGDHPWLIPAERFWLIFHLPSMRSMQPEADDALQMART